MTAPLWLDTEAARRAVAAWTRHADTLHRRAYQLELQLVGLSLDEHLEAVHHLTAAATGLWDGAAFTRRFVDRVTGHDGQLGRTDASVARLLADVRADASTTSSSAFGDLGETGRREIRRPYAGGGGSPDRRARTLLTRALADTADHRQLRPDEFELVRLDSGRFVVVLPGVVDLSSPHPGWDEHHRSVRDLDQAAFGSSRSTGTAGNPYARLVRDGLERAGVPHGADILIVGHSFGADTALDLAADGEFNGPSGYHVTHVVAAGYHSGPQLSSVPGATDVLVLQNRHDVPVVVEAVGAAHVTDALVDAAAAMAAWGSGDVAGAVRHQTASFGHQAAAWWSGVRRLTRRADDVAQMAFGVATRDPVRTVRGLDALVTPRPGVSSPADGRVVSVFQGGTAGFGHRPAHYVDHLDTTDDPLVVAFLTSIDRAGYTAPGVAVAIDVSVP